jgi:hypothetical protein
MIQVDIPRDQIPKFKDLKADLVRAHDLSLHDHYNPEDVIA